MDVTQTHNDVYDPNGNKITRVSTTTCAHFRFITSTYTTPTAPPDALAAVASNARQMFPGVFDDPAESGPHPSPVASPVSSPSMPALVFMDEDTAAAPTMSYDIALAYNCNSSVISISSVDSDETEDDVNVPPPYTVGNGLRYLHDPITGTPKVAIADPTFEAATKGITRFYIVTTGAEVGIFKTL